MIFHTRNETNQQLGKHHTKIEFSDRKKKQKFAKFRYETPTIVTLKGKKKREKDQNQGEYILFGIPSKFHHLTRWKFSWPFSNIFPFRGYVCPLKKHRENGKMKLMERKRKEKVNVHVVCIEHGTSSITAHSIYAFGGALGDRIFVFLLRWFAHRHIHGRKHIQALI